MNRFLGNLSRGTSFSMQWYWYCATHRPNFSQKAEEFVCFVYRGFPEMPNIVYIGLMNISPTYYHLKSLLIIVSKDPNKTNKSISIISILSMTLHKHLPPSTSGPIISSPGSTLLILWCWDPEYSLVSLPQLFSVSSSMFPECPWKLFSQHLFICVTMASHTCHDALSLMPGIFSIPYIAIFTGNSDQVLTLISCPQWGNYSGPGSYPKTLFWEHNVPS